MQQIEINILQPRLLQTLIHTRLCALIVYALGRDFGGEEELFSGNAGFKHAFCDGRFVAVGGCAVDVAVAGFDGVVGYGFAYGGGGLVDAVA